MMSKDGLDGGLRGRVLEGIEPRKGTETKNSLSNFFILLEGIEPRKGTETKNSLSNLLFIIVRRNRTPKGDGNSKLPQETIFMRYVRRNRTPKGDGNP